MNPLVGSTWTQKCWFHLGNRLKGDALNDDWTSGYASAPNIAALRSMWWTSIVGWVNIQPGAANTCTNAVVLVYDMQVQIFNISTQAWELASNVGDRSQKTQRWYHTATFADEGSCDPIYPGINNIPRFSCVKLPADRLIAATIPGDELKFKNVHNGLTRYTVDPAIVGGVAVLCRARIEPISGSFNGSPQILMQIAADAYPNGIDTLGNGLLTGINGTPAIGASAFALLSATDRVFCFTTAKINPSTYIENRSDYMRSVPAGTYPHTMDGALFAANVPQFITF